MDSPLPPYVAEELVRRANAAEFARQEAAVREALIVRVEKAFEFTWLGPGRRRILAEIAVDALADFVDSGHEYVEDWHGKASTHG